MAEFSIEIKMASQESFGSIKKIDQILQNNASQRSLDQDGTKIDLIPPSPQAIGCTANRAASISGATNPKNSLRALCLPREIDKPFYRGAFAVQPNRPEKPVIGYRSSVIGEED